MGVLDGELLFEQSIAGALRQIQEMDRIDLVVGIPFLNEKEALPKVLKVVERGLADSQLLSRSLIVCVGDPVGAEALEAIKKLDLKAEHLEFLMLPGSNGRGASIRAIMTIADRLEADLLILAADLVNEDGSGIQPWWIKRLLEPIIKDYDFVLTVLRKNFLEDLLNNFFLMPLLEIFYGYRIRGMLGGVYAISHDMVEDCCAEIKFWLETTRSYGIDPWLITRVIRRNKKICEIDLGNRHRPISLEKLQHVFKESARALFESIKRDEEYWLNREDVLRTPDIYGEEVSSPDYEPTYSTSGLIQLFKRGFNQYKSLFEAALSDVSQSPSSPRFITCAELQRIVEAPSGDFRFDAGAWASVVYRFLIQYGFASGISRDDILNALTASFCGRLAGLLEEVQALRDELKGIKDIDPFVLLFNEVAAEEREQRRVFLALKDEFRKAWERKSLEVAPPLVPQYYLEFIPGIPITMPKKLEGRGGRVVWTDALFNRLQMRYQEAFNHFVYSDLGVPESADSVTIAATIRDFMKSLDAALDEILPGDLYTEEGTRQVVEGLFKLIAPRRFFSIKDEIFREALLRYPPLNVMIPAGCNTPRVLVEKMDVRDAITLGNLVENRKWADSILLWVLENTTPDDLEEVEVKPIVLGDNTLGGSVKLANISDLNKLTGRIAVRPLSKGMGGEYPKLRYCLFIARHMMIMENYSYLNRTYARERKNLGLKIRNSLIGRYESGPFSAHNIFENLHHRALVRRFRALSERLAREGLGEAGNLLGLMCDGYGLSQVLADGTFIPCSAWTWASYSYKGGRGIPTPLSSHVEEKWFNHDFLEEIYAELGYDPGEITRMAVQLIGEGRASENLLDVLLGIRPKDVSVVVQESKEYPPAGQLKRYPGNPILSPKPEHPWESKYVLNPAAFRLEDKVYLLYRAFGDDQISRIGLAVTDGYRVLERLPEPVFVPQGEKEKKGVEDPRVVIIDDWIYMLYTAYDGVIAQISFAGITVEDFLNRRFDRWVRKGYVFQDIWDKDSILFPEKIGGKYVIYHRIEPGIWVTRLDRLEFPAPREKHSIIAGPRPGRMWDSLKIGAGAQPLKTKYGWLLIYHGVDRERVYRLGVMLVALNNPERLLYRSPNPILSPETDYETGKIGDVWVPQVVFTCGAVPAENKEVLDADDEVLVYYGAADTYVCLATGKVGELIPEAVRREIEKGVPF
ncbi:MAG: glycosidase [Thermacetogeniaceae bacterium]